MRFKVMVVMAGMSLAGMAVAQEEPPSEEETPTQSEASMPTTDPDTDLPIASPQNPEVPGAQEPGFEESAVLDGRVVDVKGRRLFIRLDKGADVSVLATASTRIDGQLPRSAEHLERLLERKRGAEEVRIRFEVEGQTNIALSID